jgi:hypothetical protein
MSKKTQLRKQLEDTYVSEETRDSLLDLAEQSDKFHALKAIGQMEGGRVLKNALVGDILSAIHKIGSNHGTYTLQEFVALGAAVQANLILLSNLTGAEDSMKAVNDEIEEALRS